MKTFREFMALKEERSFTVEPLPSGGFHATFYTDMDGEGVRFSDPAVRFFPGRESRWGKETGTLVAQGDTAEAATASIKSAIRDLKSAAGNQGGYVGVRKQRRIDQDNSYTAD